MEVGSFYLSIPAARIWASHNTKYLELISHVGSYEQLGSDKFEMNASISDSGAIDFEFKAVAKDDFTCKCELRELRNSGKTVTGVLANDLMRACLNDLDFTTRIIAGECRCWE